MSICSFRGIVVIDIEYDYDSEGRVTKEQYTSNGTTVTVKYVYDGLGRLVSVNDGFTGRTTNYSYDADGNLLCVETKEGGLKIQTIRYRYDALDRIIEQSTSLRTSTTVETETTLVGTAYVYNAQQRLGQITAGNIRQNATYYTNGTLAALQTGTPNTSGGIATTVKSDAYTYDGADSSLKQHTISVLGNTAYTYSYQYDSKGNITKITRVNAGSSKSINYTYDAANQLVREDNQIAGYSWAMTYDNAGNMLTRKKYSYTTGTLGSVLSTQTFTYGKDGWGDVLTKINSTTVTSDASGNLLSDGTNTYTWKNGRQLATSTKNGVTWTYTYDASGMRTQRVSGSTVYAYIYDGGNLNQMTVGSNALIFTYGINGQPMSVNYNGTDYYYITNSQGDVVGILNGSGTEVVTYTYDAWGNILSTTGSMAGTLGAHNPLRYRGYVYDQETGLYYLQSRYYNPTIGRFISADIFVSTDQGILGNNMFIYCLNNPVCHSDPVGQSATIAGAIIGGIFGAINGLINGDSLEDVLACAATGAITGALAGFAADISIASFGVGGAIIASAVAGGICSGANSVASHCILNDGDISGLDPGKLLFDVAIGALAGGTCTAMSSLSAFQSLGIKEGVNFAKAAIATEKTMFISQAYIGTTLWFDIGATAVTTFGAWTAGLVYDYYNS